MVYNIEKRITTITDFIQQMQQLSKNRKWVINILHALDYKRQNCFSVISLWFRTFKNRLYTTLSKTINITKLILT